MISARDVLFDEDKFHNRKPICFTDTLINELDEIVAKVAIAPNQDLDDVQLREDSNIENTEDIQEINEQDKVKGAQEVEKGLELIEDDSESMPYPTPESTIESSFLT